MRILLILILSLLLQLKSEARRSRIDSLLVKIQTELTDSVRAGAYYQLGKDYLNINSDSSVMFSNMAVDLSEKIDLRRTEAESYSILGVNEKNNGNYEKALEYHLQALRIKEEDHLEDGLAITYNDIGVLYKIMGRFSEALEYYKKSNAICRKLDYTKGVAMTYNNIGTIHRELSGEDSALYYYQLALSVAEEMGDPYSLSVCMNNVADVYSTQGRFEEALALFKTCLRYDKELEHQGGIAYTYNNIARTLSSMKEYESAYRYSDSAMTVVRNADLRHDRMATLMIRAGIEEGMGKPALAMTTIRQYLALKDSLLTEETSQQISELQTQYETAQKEKQIALQEAKLREKNLIILGIAIAVTLLLMLGYSWYRRHKMKQQALLQRTILHQQEQATRAIIEAEERERKRIALELHDGVGQLMSAARMNLSSIASELNFPSVAQQEAFTNAISLVDEGCKEVRTVSHNILPNALLKAGLAAAVREFVNRIDQRVLKVNLFTQGLNEKIEGNIEPVLYRIIQECVNNVIKHAGANTLDIAIIKDPGEIAVTIEDNGAGFDVNSRNFRDGIGMNNIRSRVEYLNGQVEWDTAPGKGTVVMIQVPLNNVGN